MIVVIDEAYFEFNKKTYTYFIKDYENVVILRTMSKAFGIADLRVGYLIGNEKVVEYLEKIAIPFQIPTIVAVAATAALEDMEYMEKTTKIIIQERERLYRELSKFKQLKPYPSKANFILIKIVDEKIKADEIVNTLLEDGISIRGATGRPGLKGEFFRISIGKPEHNNMLLEKLEEILEK